MPKIICFGFDRLAFYFGNDKKKPRLSLNDVAGFIPIKLTHPIMLLAYCCWQYPPGYRRFCCGLRGQPVCFWYIRSSC